MGWLSKNPWGRRSRDKIPTRETKTKVQKSRCARILFRIKLAFYMLTFLCIAYCVRNVYLQVTEWTQRWSSSGNTLLTSSTTTISTSKKAASLDTKVVHFTPSSARDTNSQLHRQKQFLRLVALRQSPAWKSASTGTEINGAFVHMGKTGGSSLSLLLRNGCHSFMPKPCRTVPLETAASRLVGTYYHVPDFGLIPQGKHPFYIMTLRDPLARSISAFVYEHIDNVKARGETLSPLAEEAKTEAKKCFPSLESFVEAIGDDPQHYDYDYHRSQIVATNCTNLARAVVDGKVRRFNHFFFPFQKIRTYIEDATTTNDPYIQQQDPQSTKQQGPILFATRQEHLWYDWKKINYLLGQVGDIITPADKARDMSYLHQPVTRELSADNKLRLCKALQPEYDGYIQILREAINLTDQDVQESLDEIKQNCPNIHIKGMME